MKIVDDTKTISVSVIDRIRKMSIAYGNYMNYSSVRQFVAQHFDLSNCNRNNSNIHEIKIINPGIKIIGYYDAIMEQPYYSDWEYVNQQEDWFVHDIYGNRIINVDYGAYLMNPSSGWSDYYAQKSLETLENFPAYDGIFADDVPWDMIDSGYIWNVPYSSFPSDVLINWSTWMLQHIQNLQTVIGSKIVMPNAWKYPQFCEQIAHYHLFEGFIHARNQPSTQTGLGGSWQYGCLAINILHHQAELGNIIATNSGCSLSSPDAERMNWLDYTIGCFLLAIVDIKKAYYSWHFYGQDATNGWHPLMDTAFGQPMQSYIGNIQNSPLQTHAHPINCGGYQYCGGVFIREFENYYVIVNICPSFSTTYDYTGQLPNGINYTVRAKKAIFIEK